MFLTTCLLHVGGPRLIRRRRPKRDRSTPGDKQPYAGLCLTIRPAGRGRATPGSRTTESPRPDSVPRVRPRPPRGPACTLAPRGRQLPTHLPLAVECAAVLHLVQETSERQVGARHRHRVLLPLEAQPRRGAGFHWGQETAPGSSPRPRRTPHAPATTAPGCVDAGPAASAGRSSGGSRGCGRPGSCLLRVFTAATRTRGCVGEPAPRNGVKTLAFL